MSNQDCYSGLTKDNPSNIIFAFARKWYTLKIIECSVSLKVAWCLNLSQANKVPYFELSTLVWPFCSQYLIYLLILLTVCHTNPLMLVQRIRYWINQYPPNWYISLFPSFFLMVSSWYCKEKFCLGHPWELTLPLNNEYFS